MVTNLGIAATKTGFGKIGLASTSCSADIEVLIVLTGTNVCATLAFTKSMFCLLRSLFATETLLSEFNVSLFLPVSVAILLNGLSLPLLYPPQDSSVSGSALRRLRSKAFAESTGKRILRPFLGINTGDLKAGFKANNSFSDTLASARLHLNQVLCRD